MAYIRKNEKAKTWTAEIYVGRDSNGGKIMEYITCDTEKECKLLARERENEITTGNFIKVGKMKVVDGIEQWIELKRPELSPGTIRVYKMYLAAHYKPFFGDKKFKQIYGNEMLLRKFKAELLQKEYKVGKNKSKKLSPNTVYKILSVLNKIFREYLRDKNPLKYVDMPNKIKPNRRVPDDAEFAQIHLAIMGTIDEIFCLLAAWGGMRLGEICAIRPDDIFEEKGIIRVDENMTINDEYEWEYKGPKSDNGTREIAVPEYLMSLIKNYRVKKKNITKRLFNYFPGSYSHRWNRIIREKNLPEITFHALRHYHASWLYSEGFDDLYAAKRLGHDVNTLKTIYQHLWGKNIISQDDKVREKLSGKKDGQKEKEASPE